jgi:hypothetical protein
VRPNFFARYGSIVVSPFILKAAFLFAGASIFAVPASAQEPLVASGAAHAVDPAAMAAVARMSAYLRTLQSFNIDVTSTIESVLDDGQKVQFGGTTNFQVSRPNGFYANVQTDRIQREFFFDGSKLTMFAPRMQVYTSVAAPGTIKQMLDMAFTRYGITLPLADLFYWGSSADEVQHPTTAMVVGFARIGNVETDQYAFREDGVDYQLWIQRGDQPLPLKMVYTASNDLARPQYAATMKWTLNPTIASDRFTFTPPKDTYQIAAVEFVDKDASK